MTAPRVAWRSHSGRQWLLLIAALVVLGGFNVWTLHYDYRRVEQEEGDRLQATARGLGEIVAQRLVAAEHALRTVAGDVAYWRGDGGEQGLLRLQALAGALDGIRTLAILDADGRVVAASRRELLAQDLNAREYFQAASRQPDAQRVHLTAPAASALGIHTLGLSRALTDRRGHLAGVVTVTLDPDYFSAWMDALRYAPDSWAAIAHSDGKVFLFVPPRPGTAGMDIAKPGSMFSRHRDSGQAASLLQGVVYATGEDVLIAVRTVQPAASAVDKALVVAVARQRSSILAGWRTQAVRQLGLFLAVVLSSVLGLYVVQRRQWHIDAIAVERRSAAERLEMAAVAAGFGVWEFDAVADRLRWDASMYRLYAVDPLTPPTVYDDWRNCVLPEDLPAAEAALHALTVTQDECRFGFRIRRGDGQVRMIDALAWAFFAADGSLLRILGTNQDVTERWQAEAELRKLSQAVEQSAAVVLITDIHGVIEYVNPAACATYGYAASELVGDNPRRFSSGLTSQETYRTMWSTILAGQEWRGELENRRADGSRLHVSTSISPVRDSAGGISHFVAIQEDVSARVAAERLQSELEARLGRVERMEVLGAMTGGLAHDFNNILVAILGFSGLGKVVLEAAGGPARVVRYFEEIETAGERARDLVQQLLVFSRRGPLTLATVAVADVVNDVLGLVVSSFPGAVTLSASLDDDLPLLDIDRSHLQRVLVNLCLNARDAMDGPGAVVVSARRVRIVTLVVCASCHKEFAGEFLRIAVTDEGCGIAETVGEHVFDPFFTTKEVGAGSGMGLAVVHGLVHLYGGHVQIATAPAQGAEMAILLPQSMWHLTP